MQKHSHIQTYCIHVGIDRAIVRNESNIFAKPAYKVWLFLSPADQRQIHFVANYMIVYTINHQATDANAFFWPHQ